ncbi:MAG: nitroreductase family protein [Chloroflexi bacterium]|nr:nitroreductase family protein [Chloroflexota bacterium]
MELYDVMTTAETTRRFQTTPVPRGVLHRVLDKARFAPNGGNRQGWHVIVVTSPETRRALRDLYRGPWQEYLARWHGSADPARSRRLAAADQFAETLHDIPVHVIVCTDINTLAITDAALGRPSIVGGGSVYPFVQNILLGCHNEGLGAALTTLVISREPELRKLLRIPERYAVAAHLLVGYPVRRGGKLSRRPVEEFATYERFDGNPVRSEGP